MASAPIPQGGDLLARPGSAGHPDDGQEGVVGPEPDGPQDSVAVDVGEHQVEQDQVDGRLGDDVDRLLAVCRHDRPVPLAGQELGQEGGQSGVVLDDEQSRILFDVHRIPPLPRLPPR